MLFARRSESGNGIRKQTLAEHSHNVAGMTSACCVHAGIENLGRLVGLIHDCSKSYAKWQNYLEYGGTVIFHAPYADEFITRSFSGMKPVCAELTMQMLSMAVRAHHGGLHDALTPAGEKDLPSRPAYTPEEVASADEAFFHEVASLQELKRLFQLACKEVETQLRLAINTAKEPRALAFNGETSVNEAMFYMGLTQRLLYAALIDADRLDAACWEEGEALPQRPPCWSVMLENLKNRLKSFDAVGIGRLRAEISEKCGMFDAENGVFRLFVPTGGGKTLSSLRIALSMAEKYGKRRIIYAEPYLTILSQAAEEIRKAIGEDINDKNSESQVLEFHSNVAFDEDDDETEKEQRYAKFSERLDRPIVLTSTVQLLNTLYAGKSACARRLAAFTDSVIIVDEVQAVPTDSIYLFSMAMNYLARFCNCLIILCTATPPALDQIKYPVRFASKPDVANNSSELFAAFQRTQIITFSGRRFGMSDMSNFVLKKMEENRNCLVIMNTKATAQKLFRLVSEAACGECSVFYLSTALCPANRDAILNQIKKALPRERMIVISTQLIEAGVDISFQCVVRSLAGLDSIIQASGRCNRHGEMPVGRVYVVDCAEENLSLLKDIQQGKKITGGLIALGEQIDLSSPQTVRRYYEKYFLDREGALEYQIEGGKTATTLLGNNIAARMEYRSHYGMKYGQDLLAQSFYTVGREYKPICDNISGVVAPYGNAAEIFEKLKAASGNERLRAMRKLQKFCVNIYNHQLENLKAAGVITFHEEVGIWILKKEAYHPVSGVDIGWRESIDKYIL